jgi:hypothetical protein
MALCPIHNYQPEARCGCRAERNSKESSSTGARWELETLAIHRKRIVGRVQRVLPGCDRWDCTVSAVTFQDPKKPSSRVELVLDRAMLSGLAEAQLWVEQTIREVVDG